jgi:hypothetical protein
LNIEQERKMKKMNAKIKNKWVENLRNGKFKQTSKRLRIGDSFCCLGVLCETMNVGYNPHSCYPSKKTLDKAGIDIDTARKLAIFNDEGKSFNYISAYIKRYL